MRTWVIAGLVLLVVVAVVVIAGIGGLIVTIAGSSIVGVMYIVLQEKHEHEEHYTVPHLTEKPSDTAE